MTELENYKFKKSQELLNKPDIGEIGSFILGFDAAMEYKNQFSQLPTSVTDKDIERMTEAEFPTTNSIYDRVQEKRIVYAKGLKDMRSLLNHPPVMGEGEKEQQIFFTYDKQDGGVFCAFTDEERARKEAEECTAGLGETRLVIGKRTPTPSSQHLTGR